MMIIDPDDIPEETLEAAYLARLEHRPAVEGSWYSDYGLQLSRGFRALKI